MVLLCTDGHYPHAGCFGPGFNGTVKYPGDFNGQLGMAVQVETVKTETGKIPGIGYQQIQPLNTVM